MMSPAPDEFPKRCGCGRCYARGEWERLPVHTECWELDGDCLQLRNCGCERRSTLAVALTREGAA